MAPIATTPVPVEFPASEQVILMSLILSLIIFAARALLDELRGLLKSLFMLIEETLRWVFHILNRFNAGFPEEEKKPAPAADVPRPALVTPGPSY